MTNEQLTQEVIKLAEHQAKCDAERDNILMIIEELRQDIKSTKSLAEDVHIMAIQMQDIQKTQEETREDTNKKLNEINVKVNALSSEEFLDYKENKKIIKQNILNKVVSAIVGGIITYMALKLGLDKFM